LVSYELKKKLTLLSFVESSFGIHEVGVIDVLQGRGTFHAHPLEPDESFLLNVILSTTTEQAVYQPGEESKSREKEGEKEKRTHRQKSRSERRAGRYRFGSTLAFSFFATSLGASTWMVRAREELGSALLESVGDEGFLRAEEGRISSLRGVRREGATYRL